LQNIAVWTFIPLHGDGAGDKEGMWIIKNDAQPEKDPVEGVVGSSAFDACIKAAAGYVMLKCYECVCQIGTSRAKPCPMSALPTTNFVKGAGSVTHHITNKNGQVKLAFLKPATAPKDKTFRLVGTGTHSCISCLQARIVVVCGTLY
jgi:hypothetical protein